MMDCSCVFVFVCASKHRDTLSKPGFGVVRDVRNALVYMTLFVISQSFVIPLLICRNKWAGERTVCASLFLISAEMSRHHWTTGLLCICFVYVSAWVQSLSSGLPAIHLSAVICKGLFNCDRHRPIKPLSCTLFA